MAHMPPKDISAVDLWERMTALPRPHRVVPLPRKGPDGEPIGYVAMVVLTQAEVNVANAQANQAAKKFLKDSGASTDKDGEGSAYATLYTNCASNEILARACKHTDDLSKQFFPGATALSTKLTTDEIGVMVRQYNLVQAQLGPVESEMDQESVDAWVERLADGGCTSPLSFLSLGAMSILMMSMAVRLWESRTGSSSPGTPQE